MMEDFWNYTDYKEYFNSKVQSLPGRGRGYYTKMAKYLNVSTVLVSQVLKGNRHFDRDKLYSLTLFFEMDDQETEFLLCLYDRNVAKKEPYKQYLDQKLKHFKDDYDHKGFLKKSSLSGSSSDTSSQDEVRH